MSKAFTRESDESTDVLAERPPVPPVPAGVPNYLTANGAARLRAELARLLEHERPRLISVGSDTASTARRELDRRVEYLTASLETAEVVTADGQPRDRVAFGARVTVRDGDENERRYTIVGVDEAEAERGRVSWRSPIARALLGARVGDAVTVRSPRGNDEWEILAIEYPDA